MLFIFALRRWVRGFYEELIQIIKSYTRLNNKAEKSVLKMLKPFLLLRTSLFSDLSHAVEDGFICLTLELWLSIPKMDVYEEKEFV